jgi:hypothetical protein
VRIELCRSNQPSRWAGTAFSAMADPTDAAWATRGRASAEGHV